MTGLEKIIAEIKNDAKEVAGHQEKEAQKKADAILEEVKNEIKAQKEQSSKNAKVKYDDIIDRAKSSCELETRKAVLNKKQELIFKVIEDAKLELANLPTDEYFNVLLKLAKIHSGEEKATLTLGKKDLERVTNAFKESLPKEITVSDEACNIENGFLLIYDGIDINCSFDALFDDKLEELQDKAASILFF